MIECTKITVIKTKGTDKIYIFTTNPSPFAHLGETNMVLQCEAPYDEGIDFVKTNFNIEPKVIIDR